MNTLKQRSVVTTALISIALCGLYSVSAQAGIVVSDQFDNDGPLVGSTPGPGPGGTWAAHSGAGNVPIMVSGGMVVLTHGAGSREDANSNFAPVTSGLISYSFDFSVDSLAGAFTGTDFEYFASFGATGGASTLLGRLDLVAPTAGGDFAIGIATSGGTADAVWGTDFTYDTVISVLVQYDLAMNQASLSVNGGAAIFAALNGAGTTSIDDFSFRQSNSSNDETIRIDNLVVSAVPLPAAVWLFMSALGGMGFLRRRRNA